MNKTTFFQKLFSIVIKSIIWIFISYIIIMICFFLFYPTTLIKDYTFEETINLVNKHIYLNREEVLHIIFSQWVYNTFLWDWWYDIAIKLSESWKNRLIQENKSYIWIFEFKNIVSDRKCNFLNEHNNNWKNIKFNSDFKNDFFYYVSKLEEYRWGEIIYIDAKNNILYYCSYRT